MLLIRRLAALIVVTLPAFAADSPPPVALRAVHPARGDVVRYVTLPGIVKPNLQVTLFAKVPGYLKSLTVDKGDKVQAGQLLAEIEVPELVADLAKLQVEVAVAETTQRRLAGAQAQAPDLVTPLALEEASGRLEIARASLGRTQTLLGFSRITAPFAGMVTARYVDPGAYIPAGPSGNPAQTAAVVTLMDFATVRVQVAVPELETPLVVVGQPVIFSCDALPGKTFEAKISRFGFALDPATKTMLVEADFTNAGQQLRPGMYATVRVGVEKHPAVLTVPVDALVMEKTAAFVFTDAGGRAKKVAIKPGFNDGVRLEVSGGLTENDLVLLAGKAPLTDGQVVTATEEK